MKKYFLLLLVGVAFTACSDDEPVVPELNKVTKVTCYKNDEATPLFVADIRYTSDGKISTINTGDDKYLFVYSDGKFSVTGVRTSEVIQEYTLSGNVITGKSISRENPYLNHEMYVSDDYSYRYSGSNWVMTEWTARWPQETSNGYEERNYPEYEKYTWENGNVVLFAQSMDKREMKYEYSMTEAPRNFPLRVIGSYTPVGFDVVSPLNLMYGAQNRNLPVRAYAYTIQNQNDIKAEYKYNYTTVGDYITAMTIDESVNDSTNVYKYTFEYNFGVK